MGGMPEGPFARLTPQIGFADNIGARSLAIVLLLWLATPFGYYQGRMHYCLNYFQNITGNRMLPSIAIEQWNLVYTAYNVLVGEFARNIQRLQQIANDLVTAAQISQERFNRLIEANRPIILPIFMEFENLLNHIDEMGMITAGRQPYNFIITPQVMVTVGQIIWIPVFAPPVWWPSRGMYPSDVDVQTHTPIIQSGYFANPGYHIIIFIMMWFEQAWRQYRPDILAPPAFIDLVNPIRNISGGRAMTQEDINDWNEMFVRYTAQIALITTRANIACVDRTIATFRRYQTFFPMQDIFTRSIIEIFPDINPLYDLVIQACETLGTMNQLIQGALP
jgi:hypothetical protein